MVVSTPAASRLPDGGRFAALDSWRGIAALVVVGNHLTLNGLAPRSAALGHGWIAVDFFFVLSGFVISAAYGHRLAGGFPIRRFMLLRLGRVYPLHLVVLALFVAAEFARIGLRLAGFAVHQPFANGHDAGGLLLTALLVQVFAYP